MRETVFAGNLLASLTLLRLAHYILTLETDQTLQQIGVWVVDEFSHAVARLAVWLGWDHFIIVQDFSAIIPHISHKIRKRNLFPIL